MARDDSPVVAPLRVSDQREHLYTCIFDPFGDGRWFTFHVYARSLEDAQAIVTGLRATAKVKGETS